MPTYLRTINIDSPIHLEDSFVERAEELLMLSPDLGWSLGIDSDAVYGHLNNGNDRRPASFMMTRPLGDAVYFNRGYEPLKLRHFDTARIACLNYRIHYRDEEDWLLSDCRYIAQLMYVLLQMIEIRLRKRRPKPTEPDITRGDFLGLYHSRQGGDGVPYIELFPEEIEESARNSGIPGMSTARLATKVLVHELAHAFLDPWNSEDRQDRYSEDYRHYFHGFQGVSRFYGNTYETMNFYHVREESLANVITLRIYNLRGTSAEFTAVRKYIDGQPAAYRLALDLVETPRIAAWLRAKEEDKILLDDAEAWMDDPCSKDFLMPWGEKFDFMDSYTFYTDYKLYLNELGDSLADGYLIPGNPVKHLLLSPDIKRGGYFYKFLLYDKGWNLKMAFPPQGIIVLDKDTILCMDRYCWRVISPDGKDIMPKPNIGRYSLGEMEMFIPEEGPNVRNRFCPKRILAFKNRDEWAIIDCKFNIVVDFNNGKVPEGFPYK